MLIFKIIFIVILLLEIGIGLIIKHNIYGLQDKIVSLFTSMDIEDYIRNQFPSKWILQMIFLLVLFILCIC